MTTRKKVSDPSPDESLLEMDTIVADLRNLRMASLEQRKRHDRPPRLPSRKILADITDGLSAALFPNRLGSPKLTDEDIDHYVGKTLDKSLKDLLSQVQRELNYASTPETTDDQDLDRAARQRGRHHLLCAQRGAPGERAVLAVSGWLNARISVVEGLRARDQMLGILWLRV